MKKNYLSSNGYCILLALSLQLFNAKAQQTYTYNYTGAVQTVNLPAGIYKVECWGADGGGTTGTNSNAAVLKLGGKGGYATGTLTIPASTTASVYVGGKGNTEGINVPGGFNGGGNSGAGTPVSGVCGSGGGASDIRIGGNAFSDRKIVAGGGGAAGYQECNGTAGVISGGHGGGTVGGDPVIGVYAARIGHGGTQTAGGAGGTDATYAAGNAGSFGLGANGGTATATSGNGAGGGGGWYGGGSGSNGYYCAGGGGGGSSYIGGVTNGVTIMFGQPGFVANPDITGDGYVIITALNTPINVTATSSAICIGSGPVTMTASGVTTYTWLPVGSFAGSNSAIITDNPTSTTVYTVQGTDALGLSVSQFTVYVNDPHVNIVPSNTVICLGQSIPLVASGASSYSWSSQNGGFSTVTSGTLVFDSNTMPSGSYNIIGTDLIGCVAPTQTAEVTVLSPAAAISGPSITCKGNYYTLSASGADTYTWSTGSNSSSISVSPNVNTVYTLIGGQSQGNVNCYNTASLSVTAYNSPGVGAISNRNNICSGENVLLTAIGAINYTWTNGVTTHTGSTWQVNPISNQTTSSQGYTVTGSNQYNCSNTSTIAITVNPCTGIAENNGASRISIYPNPNKGEFVISAAQAMELQIINETGQVVKTIKIDKDKTEIKLNNLSSGVYFIVGKGEQGTVKEKIIVEK